MNAERETWKRKFDFLLSVIGYAVDLTNVWRFPAVCYRNGGGAFMVAYFIMFLICGVPLFFLEMAVGQYHKSGALTVWLRICPALKGIGFSICIMATYLAWYYNTILAWAMYYLVQSFTTELPWTHCRNEWNTNSCLALQSTNFSSFGNESVSFSFSSAASEFYYRGMLEIHKSDGIGSIGGVKWSLAGCLVGIYVIVYFALWRGISSSGKMVRFTATLPYLALTALLIRGAMLEGSMEGIRYYLIPDWQRLADVQVWIDAAAQVLFSLGTGFGVLLALASYNSTTNDCKKDAILGCFVNLLTSLMSGFVVSEGLGYMAYKLNKPIESFIDSENALAFITYPEILGTLPAAPFWAIIFFITLISLGLDSTFGGLEALITACSDEWPWLRRHRELFVLAFIVYCCVGSLPTTTFGGAYLVQLLDAHAVPISILLVVMTELVGICWIYGLRRLRKDIYYMLNWTPGFYWQICWLISPIILGTLFVSSFVYRLPLTYGSYEYPVWAKLVGWAVTASSISCIPIYAIYLFISTSGTLAERARAVIQPEIVKPAPKTEVNAVVDDFSESSLNLGAKDNSPEVIAISVGDEANGSNQDEASGANGARTENEAMLPTMVTLF